MKQTMKKVLAYVCAIALVVSSITVTDTAKTLAADGDAVALSWTKSFDSANTAILTDTSDDTGLGYTIKGFTTDFKWNNDSKWQGQVVVENITLDTSKHYKLKMNMSATPSKNIVVQVADAPTYSFVFEETVNTNDGTCELVFKPTAAKVNLTIAFGATSAAEAGKYDIELSGITLTETEETTTEKVTEAPTQGEEDTTVAGDTTWTTVAESGDVYSYGNANNMNIVSVQQPGWASKPGIYMHTSPAPDHITINGVKVGNESLAIDGAGAVIYLSALTASVSTVAFCSADGSVIGSVDIKNANAVEDETTENPTTEPTATEPTITEPTTTEPTTTEPTTSATPSISKVKAESPNSKTIDVEWSVANEDSKATYKVYLGDKNVAKDIKKKKYTISDIKPGKYQVKVVILLDGKEVSSKTVKVSVNISLMIKKSGKTYKYALGSNPSYTLPKNHKDFVKKYPDLISKGYVFKGFYKNNKKIKKITDDTEAIIKWRTVKTKLKKISLVKGNVKLFFNKKDWKNIDGFKITYSMNRKFKKKKSKSIFVKTKGKVKKTYIIKKSSKRFKNGGGYYFKIQFYYKNGKKKVYYVGNNKGTLAYRKK